MTVLRPKGGRGLKESYTTKVIRVPEPLIPFIDWVTDRFYQGYYDGVWQYNTPPEETVRRLGLVNLVKTEILSHAQSVLAQKKSARLTVNKLLQVIFQDKTIDL